MHGQVPAGYYQQVERQRRKASTPSDEPTTFKLARGNLATLSAMSNGGWSQRPPATGWSADGNKPPAGGDVDTD